MKTIASQNLPKWESKAVKLVPPPVYKEVSKDLIPPQHLLIDLISMKRSSGTTTEAQAAALIVRKFAHLLHSIDEAGNMMFVVGEGSRTLFCAHIDTVHRGKGGINQWMFDGTHIRAVGAPLGADDGAGCEVLAHLMMNNIAGTYLFTRGEEVGGVGATLFANVLAASYSASFDRAIAFDRKDVSSVISHQAYGRCASDAFCDALCEQLNNQGLLYMPDDGGVYTDTAEFVDIIPECTNISVGYWQEHSDSENLSIVHLEALKAAVLGVDWENLPVARDPKIMEMKDYQNLYHYPNANKGYNSAPREPLLHEEYDRFFTDPNYESEEESEWTEIDKELALMDEANFNFLYDSYDSFIDEFGDGEVVPDFRAWYADVFRMS